MFNYSTQQITKATLLKYVSLSQTFMKLKNFSHTCHKGPFYIHTFTGAHGVMVIIAGNGHGDLSSNPGQRLSLYNIALILLEKT